MKKTGFIIFGFLFIMACSDFGYVELRVKNNCDEWVENLYVGAHYFGEVTPGGKTVYADIKRPLSSQPEISYQIGVNAFLFEENENAVHLPAQRFILLIFCEADSSYWDIDEDY